MLVELVDHRLLLAVLGGVLAATAAALGVLSAPVVGVVASTLVLGERPSIHDIIGFVLMLAAAACVLLAPTARSPEAAPIEQ